MDVNSNYLNFEEARDFSRSLHLTSFLEWSRYINNELPLLPHKPNEIPAQPNLVYKNKGWISWEDWLIVHSTKSSLKVEEIEKCTIVDEGPAIISEINTLPLIETDDLKELHLNPVSVDTLREKWIISERAHNVCHANDINTTEDLVKVYIKKGSFLSFRNCGTKTNEELSEIVKQIIQEQLWAKELINEYSKPKEVNSLVANSLNHNEFESNVIDWPLNLIVQKYSLSVRAENVLRNSDLISAAEIIDYFENFKNFLKLRNCGFKANTELIKIASQLKEDSIKQLEIIKEGGTSSSLYNRQKNKENIAENKTISDLIHIVAYLNKNFNLVLDENGQEKLFYELNSRTLKFFTLLTSILKTYLSKRDYNILYYRRFINNSEVKTYSALGDIYSITRERTRQIDEIKYRHILGKIRRLLVLNTYLLDYFDAKYFFTNPISPLSNSFFNEIRKNEDVDYNNDFITIILSEINNCGFIKTRENHVLVKIEKKLFDISKLVQEVENRLEKKISKDYVIDLNTLIKKFYKKANHQSIEEIKPFVKSLFAEAFHIFLDKDDIIQFKKNDFKILPEFIEDVLLEQKRPLHIIEIANYLNSKYPGIVRDPNSLKRIIYGNSNILHLGRNSTFAHKELEKLNEKYKSGTIRDIVYEYLKEVNRRAHISEIVKHVQKFRQTNEKNIATSLKLDTSGRFKFYPKGFFAINH